MWIPFSKDDSNYLIKTTSFNQRTDVFLTNLQYFWKSHLDPDELLHLFQENNPVLEDITIEIALQEVTKLLSNINSVEIQLQLSEENVVLELRDRVPDLEDTKLYIKFRFLLEKTNDNLMMMNELILPMVHTIKHLEIQQDNLVEIIQQKDRELRQNCMEFGDITRTDLKTEPFVKPAEETTNKSLLLNTFKNVSFWDSKHITEEKTILLARKQRKFKRKVYSKETIKPKGIVYKNRKVDVKKEEPS